MGTYDWGTWPGQAPKTREGHGDSLRENARYPADKRRAENVAGADQSAAVFDKVPAFRGRIVVAIDATGSRSWYWQTARRLHDSLLDQLPPDSPIALAVYASGLDTFTQFVSDRKWLRARAAAIDCSGSYECLPAVLRHTLTLKKVSAVINVSDLTAACDATAYQYARQLRVWGTRIFILADPLTKKASIAVLSTKHIYGSRLTPAAPCCPLPHTRCRRSSTTSILTTGTANPDPGASRANAFCPL